MAKKQEQSRTFDEVVSTLGTHRFDVAPSSEGAKQGGRAMRVSKYDCAAVIAPAPDGTVQVVVRAGWVVGSEISRILDKGYQKFLKTSRLEIPATAEHLRCIHKFSEELKEAAGAISLYNEAMGTTSDVYVYDRVKGRQTA